MGKDALKGRGRRRKEGRSGGDRCLGKRRGRTLKVGRAKDGKGGEGERGRGCCGRGERVKERRAEKREVKR